MFLQTPRHELPDHFLGFANPTRLRILQRLGEKGEENVNDLAAHLRMSQPRISWHLRMLRVGGIIRTRRDGRQVYCSLAFQNIAPEPAPLDPLLGLKAPSKLPQPPAA